MRQTNQVICLKCFISVIIFLSITEKNVKFKENLDKRRLPNIIYMILLQTNMTMTPFLALPILSFSCVFFSEIMCHPLQMSTCTCSTAVVHSATSAAATIHLMAICQSLLPMTTTHPSRKQEMLQTNTTPSVKSSLNARER